MNYSPTMIKEMNSLNDLLVTKPETMVFFPAVKPNMRKG